MLISNMTKLGPLVREARDRKRLTTTSAAAMLGISQSTLSRIENDKFVEAPEPRVLKAFADLLG